MIRCKSNKCRFVLCDCDSLLIIVIIFFFLSVSLSIVPFPYFLPSFLSSPCIFTSFLVLNWFLPFPPYFLPSIFPLFLPLFPPSLPQSAQRPTNAGCRSGFLPAKASAQIPLRRRGESADVRLGNAFRPRRGKAPSHAARGRTRRVSRRSKRIRKSRRTKTIRIIRNSGRRKNR